MASHTDPAASDDHNLQDTKGSARRTSYIRRLLYPTHLDDDVRSHAYPGSGTADDPYIVDYLQNDRQDAMNFSIHRKWAIAISQAMSTLAVTFASSAYTGGIEGVSKDFDVSTEVATLGLSLFVLGFAVGPLFWAPLSEMYGRMPIYVISFAGYTAFSVAAACAPTIQSFVVLRFFASAFGSSSMANSGGVSADMFSPEQRGVATGVFVTAPFLGPALGPIAGGFLGETQSWRWILGLIAILGGVTWIATTLVTLETYAPVILGRRAKALTQLTGRIHVSRPDVKKPPKTLVQQISIALSRPWILLFREPIVFLMSLYMSIVYGTLYMFFAAIPIVFQGSRGWNQGIAGLPFVGVVIGVCLAMLLAGADNKRYVRKVAALQAKGRVVEPEARLTTAMTGSIILPIGLFLFAWTTYPSVHWIAPIIGALLFSCGLVLIFISQMGYLIDAYTVYAASVLAAGSALRSVFGAAFPLFTTQMYASLGDQWASSIPAFLVLGCVPIPFLFYKYGPKIRSKCKFALESAQLLEKIRRQQGIVPKAV